MNAKLPLLLLLLFVPQDDTDYTRCLPLKSGNSWVYESSDGSTIKAKITKTAKYQKTKTFILRWDFPDHYEEEWVTVGETGIKLWRYKHKRGRVMTDMKYPSPLTIAAFPPVEGRKWDVKMTRNNVPITRTTEMLKKESIEVPAGTFDTIPVKITETTDGKESAVITTWYAMDTGIVKRKIKGGGGSVTLELKSSKVKAPKKTARVVDPAKLEEEVAAKLKTWATTAKDKLDWEHAQLFAELHRGLFGDELKEMAAEAKAKILEGADRVKTTALEYKKYVESGKKWHADYWSIAKGEDKLKVQTKAMMLRYLDEHLKGLKLFNDYRRESGLKPCAWSYDYSIGCVLHSRYLAKNGYKNFKTVQEYHSEDPDNMWYTKEGHRSAAKSDISSTALVPSVKAWMDTYYHRIPMLHPGLKVIGSGMWDDGVDLSSPSLLDVNSGKTGLPSKTPVSVVYPPEDATGIDPHFNKAGEMPRPVPGKDEKKIGYPITLSFYTWNKLKNVKAKLFQGEKEVECYVCVPDKPTNPGAGPRNTICLMSKVFLKNRTTYTVKISCDVDGKAFTKEWKFTTR